MSQQEKEDRVKSAVKEWLSINDLKEMMLSLQEIGSELYPNLVSALILSASELKKPDLEKSLSLIKDLLSKNELTKKQVLDGLF